MNYKRRQFLQNLALGGGSLAMAPFLHSVRVHAAGDEAALPKRFVFVVKSSGIDRYNLVPSGLDNNFKPSGEKTGGDKLVDVPLSDRKLPEKLKAFEAFKDRLTIIQSLSGEGLRGNHTAGFGALSCHDSERVAIAPTIDCLLGQHLSTGPYPMYGMAISGRLLESAGWKPESSYCYPNISAYRANTPVAYQASPRKAFMELFGAAVATPEQLEKKLALNGNLMDFLTADAKRIERQLSADDKERFALYTESFASLRNIEQKKAALTGRIKEHAPELTGLYDSMAPSARIEAHFEIAAAALVAGLTNVVTLRPDTLGVAYTELGLSNSVHSLGHLQQNTASNGWTGHQARMEIEKLHLKHIANLAKKLDGIPEGNGTMLDNTLIVYLSCAGGGHHGPMSDWPFILIGGMADELRMGRYIEYPKYRETGHRTIANLYLTFMHAVGMDAPGSFGQFDSNLKDLDLTGPLAELMV